MTPQQMHQAHRERLYVDPVPSTAVFSSLSSVLTENEWRRVRERTFEISGQACQTCGSIASGRHRGVVRERWVFDPASKRQILRGFVAMCSPCHSASRLNCFSWGASKSRLSSLKHLERVNGWSRQEAVRHIEDVHERWAKLSEIGPWTLDVSVLTKLTKLSRATMLDLGLDLGLEPGGAKASRSHASFPKESAANMATQPELCAA